MNSQQESARVFPLGLAKDTPTDVQAEARWKRLTHYLGVGSAGMVVQFLDSEHEPCRSLAGKLSQAANAVASLAAIAQERTDSDPSQTGATLLALQVLTGLAAGLTEEADANEVRR